MKIRSFLAGALLLAAPTAALFSGCGGGGSGLPTPTPTVTSLPFPTNTPLPTATLQPTTAPGASFLVTTESNDGSNFGTEGFSSNSGVGTQSASSYIVTFDDTRQANRTIRIEIPNPKSLDIGQSFQLDLGQATVTASSTPAGASTPIIWGGAGFSKGRFASTGFSGGRPARFVFELQDVILTRRPSASGSTTGQSQIKLTGGFTTLINQN